MLEYYVPVWCCRRLPKKVHGYLLWSYVTFVQGKTEEADLIIVGKRGQREISERTLLGGVSGKVVRNVRHICSIFIVK